MMYYNVDPSRCANKYVFERKLDALSQGMTDARIASTQFETISELFKSNQDYFEKDLIMMLKLCSLALKVDKQCPNHELVRKIRGYVSHLLPVHAEQIKNSVAIIKEKQPACFYDWVTLMGIHIDELQLLDEELFGFIKDVGLLQFIKIEGIKEEMKVKIAKYLSVENSNFLSGAIQMFNFVNESDRVAVINAFPIDKLGYIVRDFQSFGITDESFIIEFAKKSAENDPVYTAQYFKNFGITDEATRLEIFNICRKNHIYIVPSYIQNFELTDQSFLFQIAEESLMTIPQDTVNNFQNFGITDENKRNEILKKVRDIEPKVHILPYLFQFKITNQSFLFEFAKLHARKYPSDIIALFGFLSIHGEKDRFEIAKICAEERPEVLAEYFRRFDINDQDYVIEIVKICANKSAWATTLHFKNFKITNDSNRLMIAAICAEKNVVQTVKYIGYFGFERTYIDIAKYCAKLNGVGTAKFIHKFNFDSELVLLELFMDCLKTDEDALLYINNFGKLKGFKRIQENIHVFWTDNEEKEKRAILFEVMKEILDKLPCKTENKDKIEKIFNVIKGFSLHIQNSAGKCLLRFLILAKNSQNLDWIVESGLFDDLFALRNPIVRALLTPGLFSLPEGELPTGRNGFALLAIPLYLMEQHGIMKEKLVDAVNTLKPFQKSSRKVQSILHSLLLLANSNKMNPDEKVQGFDKIFDGDIMKNLYAARGLLQLGECNWVSSDQDLTTLFRDCFEKIIPLGDFQGDISKSFEVFTNSRNPLAIIKYAAGLKTLNDREVLPCLGRYVRAVFENTFTKVRYEFDDNIHLETVFGKRADLLEIWKTDVEIDLDQMAIKGDEEPDFDIRKWVHNKLFVDKHLIGFDLRFLNDFFENKENVSKEIANEIKEYRKNATENSKKDPVFTALLLQQACIELAEAKPKDLVKYLKKVEAILEKGVLFDGRFNEFLNDIRGMVDSEKNSKRTATEGFKVVFTDDPIDLLLCGTDVTDSCQRVEGDPQNNKGLLGYLMDGKNRLLAVKDPSGKIVARCLLNVMWDGQEPVLYRERFYPSNLSAKHQQGLNELAKQVARSMKLTLTSEEGDKPYGKELQALGGPAPYEYSDGAGGLQGDGEYAIPEAFIVSFDNDN